MSPKILFTRGSIAIIGFVVAFAVDLPFLGSESGGSSITVAWAVDEKRIVGQLFEEKDENRRQALAKKFSMIGRYWISS